MADGTYRFQQPGAGQFFFQPQSTTQQSQPPQQQQQQQQQQLSSTAYQRHLARTGTASPSTASGRLKFNAAATTTDLPSPSRTPPPLSSSSSHSPSLNPYTMYPQSQHLLMNGSQAHQRFGMPMPKFQHPAAAAAAHHQQQQQQQQQQQAQQQQAQQAQQQPPLPPQHHPHHPASVAAQQQAAAAAAAATHAAISNHTHTFSTVGVGMSPAAALSSAAPHFTPRHMATATPVGSAAGVASLVDDRTDNEPLTEHYQQQLQLASESRQCDSPHFHARSVAQATKGLTLASAGEAANEASGADRNRATPLKSDESVSWTALDLSGQGLRAISTSLFHYAFLDKLYLAHNKLKVLPPEVGKLQALTHLDLSGNELVEVPSEIGMLSQLKKLLLFDNNIRTLPYEMGYLYQLDFLGIEGNPLEDPLRSIVRKHGTKALIRHLREEMPVLLPPTPRDWVAVDTSTQKAASRGQVEAFSVLTYNTLCKKYATPQQYGYTPSKALAWEHRREQLMAEIKHYDSDIVCLQETDQENYHNYFKTNLGQIDYKGVFYPKGRAHGMPEEEAKTVDGCATFVKGSKYILLDKEVIRFGQTAVHRPDAKGQDDIYNRLWQKDNIAVVVFVENRQSGDRLIIANAHMYWDPAYKDVKLIQSAIMMEEITKLADKWSKTPALTEKKAIPVPGSTEPPPKPKPSVHYPQGADLPLIICGDFNSTPHSTVYDLFVHGKLIEAHPDLGNRLYGNLSKQGMSHPFALKSAYDSIGELHFTNYTPDYKEVIDYIWYSSNCLQVSALLGDVDREYLKRVPGFPNWHFPSDHIPLVSRFAVKAKKQKVDVDFGNGNGQGQGGHGDRRERERDRT